MRLKWLHTLILLAVAGCLLGQQTKAQSKPGASAGGVFVGKSGKPMAGARLILCKVAEDAESPYATLTPMPTVPNATADKTGRFQFQGFAPGTFAIIYLPAGANVTLPKTINIKPLENVTKSIVPALRNAEIGKTIPYEARSWGFDYTLLKGQTFWSQGPQMKIWNATVRRGPQGPFLEVRRGAIWLLDLTDKAELKFDAWSF